MRDDIIDITIITRSIKNELSIRRIYEFEENVEDLITNSKPKKDDRSKTEIQK
jgi:hypothetical protein